jgi:acylphosphatase
LWQQGRVLFFQIAGLDVQTWYHQRHHQQSHIRSPTILWRTTLASSLFRPRRLAWQAVGFFGFGPVRLFMAQRWHIFFEGRVQGVGFRYTARQTARRQAIGGWVKNLPDGRVEMVAEGPPAGLREFVDGLCEAMAGYVRDYTVDKSPATGEFAKFEIRR